MAKKYTEDFKRHIVELYESGASVYQLVGEYGLVEQTVYRWIHRYGTICKNEEGENISEMDMRAMRKRIAELEMENEILKKATAIFAKKM